jgi:hypothetical protein
MKVANNGPIFQATSQANGLLGMTSLLAAKTTLQIGLLSAIGHIQTPVEIQSESMTSA